MLIAHWPLTGNLNDYSGFGRTLTDVSGSTIENGKIGQGYRKTAGAFQTDLTDIPQESTISLWFKHNGTNWLSECLFGTRISNDGFMLYRNDGDTDGYYRVYYWYNNTSAAVVGYNTWPGISGFAADTWYHLSLVRFANGVMKIYRNGDLILTQNPPSDFVSWHNNGAYLSFHAQGNSSGYTLGDYTLNDFRVYDKALSDYEAKEVSKAKILHYNFNDPYEEPTTNYFIYPMTQEYYGGILRTKGAYYSESNYRITAVSQPLGGPIPGDSVPIYTDQTFVVSGYSNLTTVQIYYRGFNSTGTTVFSQLNTTTTTDENGYFSKSITLGSYPSLAYINLGVGSASVADYYVEKVMYEVKSNPTPFVDGTRNIGINDSSGFNNIGNTDFANSPFYVDTSKIGTNAANFLNGDTVTVVDSGQLNLENYTYSFWIKLKNGFTGGFRRFLGRSGSGSDRSPGFWFLHTSNGIHLQQKLSNGANAGPGDITPITLDEWHHVVMSCEYTNGNTILKRWFNYSDFNSNTYTSLAPYLLSTANLIFASSSADYEIDDFRIYATPLSDADVKALYQRRANFDNLGNVSANELNIETEDNIVENGLVINIDPRYLPENTNKANPDSNLTNNNFELVDDILYRSDANPSTGAGTSNFQFSGNTIDTGSITVQWWMKVTSNPNVDGNNNWRRLIARTDGVRNPIGFVLEQTMFINFTLQTTTGNKRYLNGSFTPYQATLGEWEMHTYTYDKTTGTASCYRNDTLILSGPQTATSAGGTPTTAGEGMVNLSAATVLEISNSITSTSGDGCLPADIGIWLIYDRALSSDEVTYNYDNLSKRYTNRNIGVSEKSQANFLSIDEVTGTQNTSASQEITNNGTLLINGEFSEVD